VVVIVTFVRGSSSEPEKRAQKWVVPPLVAWTILVKNWIRPTAQYFESALVNLALDGQKYPTSLGRDQWSVESSSASATHGSTLYTLTATSELTGTGPSVFDSETLPCI